MTLMLYQAYQNHVDMTEPWRTGASNTLSLINRLPLSASDKVLKRIAAAFELISRAKLTYARPATANTR
jgi:poly-beta-hydroxyalkanoate depolymerase